MKYLIELMLILKNLRNMVLKEKKISGEVIYDGKILKLIKDKVLCPNGNESYREGMTPLSIITRFLPASYYFLNHSY